MFKIPAANGILLPIHYYSHYFRNIIKINYFYNYLPILIYSKEFLFQEKVELMPLEV